MSSRRSAAPRVRAALAALALIALPALAAGQTTLEADFSSKEALAPAEAARAGSMPGPTFEDGALVLLHGAPMERNSVAFAQTVSGAPVAVTARFSLRIGEGGHGLGFVLLPVAQHGASGRAPNLPAWEAPGLPGAFGVGFDVFDPPSQDIFDEWGNIDGRPQREVSLHWDGVEIAKRLSPVEFRGDDYHAVTVVYRAVAGGALASVTIDGTDVYRDTFLPLAVAYPCRPAFGARTGEVTTAAALRDVAFECEEAPADAVPPAAAVHVRTFDGAVIHSANGQQTAEFDLPDPSASMARVVLSLTLEPGPGGWDPWDRWAGVYAWDDSGQRFEIFRYITPYARAYTWRADVTDYWPMLCGRRKLGLNLGTIEAPAADPAQQKGFRVTVDLDYFPGEPARRLVGATVLWSGFPEYGNPESPLDRFFEPRTVAIPPGADGATVRLWVTGHGMAPDGNAAEFLPVTRTLTVNGRSWENLLWKEDNYLNPCRPQGGTWKFPRAGWAPGDLVTPWDVDVSDELGDEAAASVAYTPQPYVNRTRDQGQASHWVEGQMLFFARRE